MDVYAHRLDKRAHTPPDEEKKPINSHFRDPSLTRAAMLADSRTGKKNKIEGEDKRASTMSFHRSLLQRKKCNSLFTPL